MHRRGTVTDASVPSRPVPPSGAHGDDAAAVARALGVDPADLLDLAATTNPVAPDPVGVVRRHADAVRSYPDEKVPRRVLAETMGVDQQRLVLTNGGAEAIALVAAEHPDGRVDDPEFSLYRRHLAGVHADGLRWASNPNNPTGRLAGDDEDAFVWDEAFYPLSTGRWTRGDGTYTVGSLTKLLACPGLRLGYVIAPDDAASSRLVARRPRWSVNGIAVAALPELLARVDLPRWAARIRDLRDDLVGCLRGHGFEPHPSDAPWVLLPDAPRLRDLLAGERVLVRDCASFGLVDHVRIAVPSERGLERLDAALHRVAH